MHCMVTTGLTSMEDYRVMLWQCLLLHYSVLLSTQEIAGRRSECGDLLGAQPCPLVFVSRIMFSDIMV